jgi:hypothetical protein
MKTLLTFIFLTLTLVSQGQEILWDTTFVVEQVNFKVIAGRTDSGGYAHIIRDYNDTTTIDGVTGNIKILRFDNDEWPDITFSYLGNVYVADLYLFDAIRSNFRKVDGFTKVSNSKKLTSNSNYFFSYQRAGCADMNWISYLFYIDNYRVTQIGEIHGKGCESEDFNREIEISKIVTLDKIFPIETLPIDTIETYEDYKWGFIKDYWNKNFEKFKNKNAP